MENQEPTGIFAQAAESLLAYHLAVIPCPGDNGKSPRGAVAGFQKWRGPPSIAFVRKMMGRFADANIGVVTSASGLTVVDIDDGADVVVAVINRAGETPLSVATPSGGRHLYYRSCGEPNKNLRSLGLKVDIKGASAGVVIVPPSQNRKSGIPYAFDVGNWTELVNLPTMRPEWWCDLPEARVDRLPRIDSTAIGNRNNALFGIARHHAARCESLGELNRALLEENGMFPIPLDGKEVAKIASSAWSYKKDGKQRMASSTDVLWRAFTSLTPHKSGPDALFIFALFIRHHWHDLDRRGKFIASPQALAGSHHLPTWGEHRVRNALKLLCDEQLVVKINAADAERAIPLATPSNEDLYLTHLTRRTLWTPFLVLRKKNLSRLLKLLIS